MQVCAIMYGYITQASHTIDMLAKYCEKTKKKMSRWDVKWRVWLNSSKQMDFSYDLYKFRKVQWNLNSKPTTRCNKSLSLHTCKSQGVFSLNNSLEVHA